MAPAVIEHYSQVPPIEAPEADEANPLQSLRRFRQSLCTRNRFAGG